MKRYIYSLLWEKGFSNEANDEAKFLMQLLIKHYDELYYKDDKDSFFLKIPSDCPHYGFFHKYECQGNRNIEGTPIHWCVVCYDTLQIWLL